jgi:hypothetical protein
MDQFLGPWYDRDLDSGRISREEAAELLEATWLKLLAIKKIRSWSHTRYSAGGPLYQNVTIGGVDRDGKDATNRLSYLILETVGELKLTAEAKEGVLKVSKLTAGGTGQDLDLEGTGKIALRDPFPESLSDLNLRFRFSDGYKGRNEMTKSLFGPPGSNIPALFELADPRIKSSRRADGYYGWHMAGPLRDPKFEPSAVGGFGTANVK